MLKTQVKVGGYYRCKVSDKVVTVRIDRESRYGGWDATNTETGRSVHIKTAGRLRGEAPPPKKDAPESSKVRAKTEPKTVFVDPLPDGLRKGDNVLVLLKQGDTGHVVAGELLSDSLLPGGLVSVQTPNGYYEVPAEDVAPLNDGPDITEPTEPQGKTYGDKQATALERLKARKDTGTDTAPHVVVEARAGTGKTTTLVAGLQKVKGLEPTDAKGRPITPSPQQKAVWDALELSRGRAQTVAFVAFNRSIAGELKERVPPGCEAMTMHSLGNAAVRRAFGSVKLNEYRVRDIIAELTGKDPFELRRKEPEFLKATESLVDLCKMNLTGLGLEYDEEQWEEALDGLASHYDVDLNGSREKVFALVPKVLDRCKDVAKDRSMDFADMIWLPIALNLSLPKYDLLLVDECLPGWTPVMMGNGSSKPISEVAVGDRVRSFNVEQGRAKNCTVTAVQKLPNRKPLVKVKARHNHKTAGNRKTNQVVCTTDHKVWTVNRGWQEAGGLQIGDVVIIETSAKTTQKGKITKSGRDRLSSTHEGNTKGTGANGGQTSVEFNRIKGGNGKGPSVPQQLLWEALGEGWEIEHVVKTGDAPQFGRGDRPSHYKIDLANPEKRIAVEIDGPSHRGHEETDRKKETFLSETGWTVFRYSNRQIARDFPGILQELCPDGENCPMPATIESVEETYITEHYVYDITVETCHNFYANGILVHNCQDLNRCQQALALRSGRRLVLCGDPKQAIYGFAGADAESMPRMIKTLTETERGCVVLPLTVTRRCGKAIVAEAKKIVPDFDAFETNGEGVIRSMAYNDKDGRPSASTYDSAVQDGDFLLCRVNAPLVSQCFRFIKAGRKANIQGRDIGKGLISTIKKVAPKEDGPEAIVELLTGLEAWYVGECKKENAKRNPSEAKLIALQDRYDCLQVFCEDAKTVAEVVEKIERIFTDDKQGKGIRLSSIHRAKGLEASRVFLLEPKGSEVPHPMARSPWQREQEMNLRYVAITRAIEELVYVS